MARRKNAKNGGGCGLLLAIGGIVALIGMCTPSKTPTRNVRQSETTALSSSAPPPGAAAKRATPRTSNASRQAHDAASIDPKVGHRTAEEIARIKRFIPKEVKLTTATGFPKISGSEVVGVSAVPSGTTVKVVSLAGDKLTAEYQGRVQSVRVSATDFLDRVIAESQK